MQTPMTSHPLTPLLVVCITTKDPSWIEDIRFLEYVPEPARMDQAQLRERVEMLRLIQVCLLPLS